MDSEKLRAEISGSDVAGTGIPPPGEPPDRRAPTDERRESLILLISACRFAEAVAVGMLVPVLPTFLSTLRTPNFDRFSVWVSERYPAVADAVPSLISLTAEGRTALLFFMTGLSMAVAQIFAGRLSDRLDSRKPFIIVGMLGGTACSALFVLAESYGSLLLTRIGQGLFLGLTFPPMMAIIARHSPPGRGGRVLGMYSTIRLLGFALGPLVGGAVASLGGYNATFLTSAGLLSISIVLVGWLIPDPREVARVERQAGEPRVRRDRPPVPAQFRVLGASTFLMMVGISALISLFPTYQREFGATEWELGLCFSAFIGTRCLLQYASGWLGDHLDKKRVLIGALVFYAPLVALQGFATSIEQVMILRAGLGAVSAAISASVAGISAERSQAGNRARVMGINTMSFSLGVALGPLLTGFIDDPRVAFSIPGVAGLLWIAVVVLVVPGDGAHRETIQAKILESSSSPPETSRA